MPIGRPVAGKDVLLLNEAGEAVGGGEVGEMVVRSRYLPTGYWRRPELTKARFLPDPEGGDRRLYRTGDLALQQPDGSILYRGRVDHQVKIRGHRVELGEIEAALGQHPNVREAVVVAQEVTAGDVRLIAYVVRESERSPSDAVSVRQMLRRPGQAAHREPLPRVPPVLSAEELREYLGRKLPDYMAPSRYVILEALPRTPNGKVDRGALPAPKPTRTEREVVAPRTPVEAVLAELWAELLEVEPISVHDNFFELGGHSLLATQVMSRLRSEFSMELTLRQLFEAPTLADFGAVLTRAMAATADPEQLSRLLNDLEAPSASDAPSSRTAM